MNHEIVDGQTKCKCGVVYKSSVYSECPVCNPQAEVISSKTKTKTKNETNTKRTMGKHTDKLQETE